jgi:energy-coupling factor transporter ATP-binding protein EcfA2
MKAQYLKDTEIMTDIGRENMAIKIIAIGGEPGSGKSTLMKKLMCNLGEFKQEFDQVKLVPYHRLENIYVLGKYEDGEVFGGTDKMSMATQPEVIKFLESLSSDSIVILEGDRLFNSSFLEHCVDKYDTTILYLQTNKDIRKERCKERGSDQNETWLAGRETKIGNILTNFMLMDNIEKWPHFIPEDSDKIITRILELIK